MWDLTQPGEKAKMLDEATFPGMLFLPVPQMTDLTGGFIGSNTLWETSHGTQHCALSSCL